MIRGIFTAAAGMLTRQTQQEVIANNLANLNTAGYKKDRLLFRNTLDASLLINQDPQVSPGEEVKTDFSPGRLYKTDSALDFAIEGEGFFVIDGGNTNFYTRNGHFLLNADGELVTPTGQPVLGESGAIVIPDGEFQVNHRGEILVDGQVINRFLVARVQAPDQVLQKAGNNLFVLRAGTPEPETIEAPIRQGYLEGANVNVIQEMVNMILAYRNFANNQKTIQTQDDTLRRAVNDLGRI